MAYNRNQPLRTRTRNSSWQWLVIGVVFGLGCSSVACLGAYIVGVVQFQLPGSVALNSTPTLAPTYTPYPTYTPPPTYTAVVVSAPTATPNSLLAPGQPIPTVSVNPVTPGATDVPAGGTGPLVGIPTDTRVPRPTLPSIAAVTQPPANPGANPTVGVPPAPSALPPTATIGNTTIIGGAATPTLPPVTAPVIRTATGSEATPAGSSEAQAEFESIASPLIPLSGGEFLLGTTQKEATQAVTDCTSRDGGKCQLTDASDSTYPHFVTLNPFSIEKTEVSVSQYVAFLNTLPYTDTVKPHTNGCGGQPCFAIFDDKNKGSPVRVDGTLYKPVNDLLRDRPMVFVTWYGASSYCRALGRRLPTEAEWERSARRRLDGNNLSIYPWGDAWDGTLANSSRPPKNAAVSVTDYANGSSAEGVLNLAGNVGEWVSDWYGENYYRDPNFTALNPKGPTSGQQKVVRGGNWSTTPFFLRSVHRLSAQPLQPTITIGFRCAIDGAPPGVDVPSPPLPSNPGAPTAVGTLKP